MKVLALGGAGDMGRTAVTTLVNAPGIKSITVADRNYELVEKFVSLAASEKLSAAKIDVTEHRDLVALISQHDLVMSTVGPYYKFGPMITEACIAAKRSCVDICDDWKPMLDILAMDEMARKAGITIIPGIGASPGLSNLLAALGASEFDEVDEIVTAWGAAQVISGPVQPHHVSRKSLASRSTKQKNGAAAATVHLLYECMGEMPTFRDGKSVNIAPLSSADPIKFPGYEDIPAFHIGHPEPVTLPRTIKANAVSNVLFFEKSFMNFLTTITDKIKSGELSIEEAALQIDSQPTGAADDQQYIKAPSIIFVTVTGLKKGVKTRLGLGLTHLPHGQMAGATGVPLGLAAIMLAEGKINQKGVLPPEAAIDPAYFLNKYAGYCGEGLVMDDVLIRKEVAL